MDLQKQNSPKRHMSIIWLMIVLLIAAFATSIIISGIMFSRATRENRRQRNALCRNNRRSGSNYEYKAQQADRVKEHQKKRLSGSMLERRYSFFHILSVNDFLLGLHLYLLNYNYSKK